MKYNEDKILKEIGEYIKSTYGQHYSSDQKGFQVLDLLKTLKIGKDFCHANAIKYLCRYGKKNGHNRREQRNKSKNSKSISNPLSLRYTLVI